MTAHSLARVVKEALAEVGVAPLVAVLPKGQPRATTWIDSEHSFGIHHYASGRHVYFVQTRMGGRMRTVTIGAASVVTRHQATMVARRVTAHALVGNDPATAREQARSAPSMDDFLAEYWEKCAPVWKASTYVTQTYYRRTYLDGAFADAFVDSLSEAEVTKWFVAVTDRAGPGGANRVLTILQAALNKAESWGYRTEHSNPCRAVRANKRRKCERFLSEPELERLGIALAEARASQDEMIPVMAAAITLLLLTGCRVGEVLGLQWSDISGNRIKLRDSKTGPRTVWLGDEARAVIEGLPRHPKIPWLFWNWRYRRPIHSVHHMWYGIRATANLPGVRLHDLRHTFASHAAMRAETLPMIGRLLGHASIKSTARYAHLDDRHTFEAAERIGAVIERAMGEGAWGTQIYHLE